MLLRWISRVWEPMSDEAKKRESNPPPAQVKTAEDLQRKIDEVRKAVEKASEPRGPLAFLKVTTST